MGLTLIGALLYLWWDRRHTHQLVVRSRARESPESVDCQNNSAMLCSPDPFFPHPYTKGKKAVWLREINALTHGVNTGENPSKRRNGEKAV